MWSWLLLCGLVIAALALLYWGLVRGSGQTRLITFTIGLIASFLLGLGLGQGWERLANYGQYIRQFSQYSRHIRGLAESGQIAELTNAVIRFDTRFYPRYDPKDLQDIVFELLKIGPYYQETNSETGPTNANRR